MQKIALMLCIAMLLAGCWAKDKDKDDEGSGKNAPSASGFTTPANDAEVPVWPTPNDCTADSTFCYKTQLRKCAASGTDSTLLEDCAGRTQGAWIYNCVECNGTPMCDYTNDVFVGTFGGLAQGEDWKYTSSACPQNPREAVADYLAWSARVTIAQNESTEPLISIHSRQLPNSKDASFVIYKALTEDTVLEGSLHEVVQTGTAYVHPYASFVYGTLKFSTAFNPPTYRLEDAYRSTTSGLLPPSPGSYKVEVKYLTEAIADPNNCKPYCSGVEISTTIDGYVTPDNGLHWEHITASMIAVTDNE